MGESGYDSLTINGEKYSGSTLPNNGQPIAVTQALVWSADKSEQRKGWKICAEAKQEVAKKAKREEPEKAKKEAEEKAKREEPEKAKKEAEKKAKKEELE